MSTTPFRVLGAVCLASTALLSAVSVALQPAFSSDATERLAAIERSGQVGAVSLFAFIAAQLPFLVAAVAVAALAWDGSPRFAGVGGTLAVLGGFGHAVFGGVGLAYLAMATDTAARATMAATVTRIESGPAVVFMAAGMLGTVLGLILLGVALFRSRAVPRWLPVALWVFVVLEFGVSGLADWAPVLSGTVYVVAFCGLAVQVWRTTPPSAGVDESGDHRVSVGAHGVEGRPAR